MSEASFFEQEIRIRVHTDGTVEIKNLADLFDALKRKAADAANAAAPLSDALGRTGAQAGTGAQQIAQYALELLGLKEGFDTASGGANSLLSAIGGLGSITGSLVPITAAVVGIGVAFEGMKAAVTAAALASDSMVHLQIAVKLAGSTVIDEAGRINQAVKLIAAETPFDVNSLRAAASQFTIISQNANAAEVALRPIADLSAALGVDLDTSARLIGRASEGITVGLVRIGAISKEDAKSIAAMSDSGERLTAVMTAIESRMGGAAQANLDTYAGRVAQVKKEWELLKEAAGKPILLVVNAVLSDAAKVIQGIRTATTPALTLSKEAFEAGEYVATAGKIKTMEELLAAAVKNATDEIDRQSEALKASQTVALAVAQAQLQAVSVQQQIAASAKSVSDIAVEIDVKFRPPAVGEVQKAVQQVDDSVTGLQQKLDAAALSATNDIQTQTAALRVFRVELEKAFALPRETSDQQAQADAQIASLRIQIAAAQQKVSADQQDLEKIDAIRTSLTQIKQDQEEMARFNALAEMALKAQAAWAKLTDQIDAMVVNAKRELAGLIGAAAGAGQVERVGADTRNALTLANFFPPEVRDAYRRAVQEGGKVTTDAIVAGFKEGDRAIQDAAQKAAELWKSTLHETATAFADMFTEFIRSGGDWGKAAGQFLSKEAKQGFIKLFETELPKLFGGGVTEATLNPATGQPYGVEGARDQNKAAADSLQKAQAYAAAAIAIVESVTSGRAAGGASFAQDAVTLGGIGNQIAPGIGLVIGVIVAGILQAFKKDATELATAASFYIKGGQAVVFPSPVMGTEQGKIYERQLQDTYDEFFNIYTKILLKFPQEVIPKILIAVQSIAVQPKLPGGLGSENVSEINQAWIQAWQQFLTGTLPTAIAGAFKPALEAGFEAMGVTAERFGQYWKAMQGVDPKKAAQFWSDMIDALNSFKAANDMFANVAKVTTSGLPMKDWNLTATGEQRKPGQNDYIYNLSLAEGKVNELALAFASLTGPEQMAAAKAMGTAVKDVMTSLIAYLNQIAQISKAIGQDVAARKLAIDLDQAKGDKVAQSKILQAEYDRIVEQIKTAQQRGLNPQEVQALYQRAADIAGQNYALDPSKATAAAYKKQLDYLAALADQQLHAMANQAQTEVQLLLDQVKPFSDYIKGLPVELDTAFTAAEHALVSFAGALDILSARIAGDVSTAPGGEHGSHPPNWTWNPVTQKWEPPGAGEGTKPNPFGGGGAGTGSSGIDNPVRGDTGYGTLVTRRGGGAVPPSVTPSFGTELLQANGGSSGDVTRLLAALLEENKALRQVIERGEHVSFDPVRVELADVGGSDRARQFLNSVQTQRVTRGLGR